MSETKHTPGPWQWFGSYPHRGVYLATPDRGRLIVMDFVRRGMNGATPRFNIGCMTPAQDLVTFQVGDHGVVGYANAKRNSSVYRFDIDSIDHPDARLIAAAPDLLEALRPLARLELPANPRGNAGAYSIYHDHIRAAVAAIAKAEGR